MKLSFTTLGCPAWDLDTIIARVREWKFDGVDFRGYRGEHDIWKQPEFGAGAAATAARFRAAGIAVPCFSSSIRLLVPADKREPFRAEAGEYARLCAAFGTPFVRVFGGHLKDVGASDPEAAARTAAEFLDELAALAPRVTFLVETHDDWVAGRELRRIMERVTAPNAGVVWDIHHPYRLADEPLEATWAAIGRWVRYVHVKDSTGDRTRHTLCLPGRGTIPIAGAVRVLHEGGYDGFLALEWEKRWHPELPEPEEAFPLFIHLMEGLR